MSVAQKWIIAHRGDISGGDENTLDAFRAAINGGADMIEFDVQQLTDGVLVVFHDDEIGGEPLANMSFTQFHERALALGLDVPTLPQTLDLCTGRIRLDVEIKNASPGDILRNIINARLRVDDYLLTSFDPAVLLKVRKAYPGVRLGLLTENAGLDTTREILDRVAADFWAPDCKNVDDTVLWRCDRLGLVVLPWTVNNVEDLQRLLSAKSVAGIITDRTRDALDLRRKLLQVIPDPGGEKSDKSNV